MNRTPGTPLGRKPTRKPEVEFTDEDLARRPVLRRGNRRQYDGPDRIVSLWWADEIADRIGTARIF